MAGLDTETSSLEYKADQIAGVCVSGGVDYSPQGYAGYYIPLRHIGYGANLPVDVVMEFVQWLIDNFQTVLFNRNFDTSMLEYDGVKIPFVGGMHDAQIMAYSVFNEAYPSLKDYSRRFLKWDMIDFAENKAKDHNFKTTDPTVSYIYAAGDPIATVFLARKLWSTYPYIRKIYKIDNYCLEAVRRLCQNELTLDYDFLETLRDETERHLAEIRTKIYSMSGVYGFNIDSSREKADVLSRFVTLTEKTKSGKFKTDEEALRRLNHPIANLMIDYAQTRVFLKSFVAKMCTYKGRTVRANYNTVNVPSGRLSSGASEGNPYFVPQNLQNCLVGDTRVQTKDGMKLLRDVKAGDFVWDGDEFRKITQKVNQGVRKVYRMTLADGKTLVGTADHPILSENGFVELAKCKDLRVALNSKKIYPRSRYGFIRFRVGRGPYPDNKDVRYLNYSSPDLWGLVGMLVGDGYSSDRKLHICFDWHATSLCYRVADVCRTLTIPFSIRTIKEKEGVHDLPAITIYNADLWRLAVKMGLTKTAREKSVPDVLYKLSPLCKMAFLKGLYAADGSFQRYKTSPCIRTVSEKLANGVVALAETLGINAKATKYKNSQLGCGYAYTVSFFNPINCQDVFTYEGQVKWAPEFHKKGLEKYVLPKSLGGYKQRYVVRHDPDYLRSKFWVKCLSIEEAGEEEVFDITVETSERFMANGIIVHNCPKDEEKLFLHHHPKIGYVLLREEEGCVRNAKGEPVKYKTKTGLHRAFIPHEKDWVIMSSDYAAQELRLAANFSRDPNFLEPLLKGDDIHMHVAKQMFGYEDPLHRTKVKIVNFSALYGAEYPTVSARLGIPLQEGKTLMTRYKQTMSKLYAWKAEIVKAAKKRGYALTYFGRPVYLLKYFNSPDRGMSAYAERLAVNATIQGCLPADTFAPSQDGKVISTLRNLVGKRVQFAKDERGTAHKGVPVFRGKLPCAVVEFLSGDFIMVSTNHKFLKYKSNTLLSIEEAAADAVQFVKPHKKVKLFKAILNTLLGRFKGTTLNSLAVFPRHDKPADSVEIATALFRAFIRDEHLITYNPVLANSVRSLVDLYGYNLVKVCSGRYALSWSRAKKSKVCFVDNLKGTYDVMSPTMISGFQTYPLSGMIHKNTGADLMRLFLIKFTKLNIDDKDWRENTRMILPVHDEMNLEVSIPYMREAWLKMRKVMNFFPENFAVPIVVDTGVGTSWGNCLDVECISPKGRVVPKDIDPDDFSGEERAYLQEILEECVFEELPDRLKKFVKC